MNLLATNDGPSAQPTRCSDPLGIDLKPDVLYKVGLAELPEEHRALMLSFIHERLKVQILTAARTVLSDDQAAEYDHLPYVDDERHRLMWLVSHCSGYRRVVERETRRLLKELRANASDLLEISRRKSNAAEPELEEVPHHG